MRILFCTHTGAWSGAEVTLMRLLKILRSDHELAVACPSKGRFAAEMDCAGIRRFPLPAVETSFRLDPIQTPRGLAALGAAGVALAHGTHRFRPDVIHASTVRAGLIGAIATRFGGPPLVVGVHDHLPSTALGRLVRLVIARSANKVVAVSDFTAERFNEGLARPVAVRVYNGIDHAHFDPRRVSAAPLRAELGIDDRAALLGVVAQITPWKGQDTAIRALAELRRDGLDAHLAIVGQVMFAGRQVRYDNHAYLRELHRLVAELGVEDAVHFLGYREDVPAVLHALDLLLLPSWDEPFALVVLESMAMGTPTLVGCVGGAPEVIEQGVTGWILPPKRSGEWACAARELLEDTEALRRMGDRARGVAAAFREERRAQEMLMVYRRALGERPRGAGTRELARFPR